MKFDCLKLKDNKDKQVSLRKVLACFQDNHYNISNRIVSVTVDEFGDRWVIDDAHILHPSQ